MSNTAIILAAGNGTRMKCEKSKLLLEIDGKTVIERSVNAFLSVSDIDKIIVTVREEDIEIFSNILTDERVTFAIGGDTRQKSVKHAVDTIDAADFIIIHDGARPLVQVGDIENVLREAKDCDAAALGVRVKDTIKMVDQDSFITDTPDRASLFAVQTPQIFNFEMFKEAMEQAEADGRDFTDDCQLIEHLGKKVKMVEGSYSNIKITTPEDIPLAENYLKGM